MSKLFAFLVLLPASTFALTIDRDFGDVARRQVNASTYVGCYEESAGIAGVRSLNSASYFNYTAMTVEMCQHDCSLFHFYGVEYGGECYCANTITSSSILSPTPSDCSMPCPGNSSEICGGPNRLNIYENPNVVAPPSSPSSGTYAAGPVGKYVPIGCYAEPSGAKALTLASYANNSMTAEMCGALCGTKYQYFGMEYGRECYCGDSLALATVAANSSCNMPCAGNATEICGAGNLLSVYNSTVPLPVVAPPPVIGSYHYLGCYVDGVAGVRDLPIEPLANFTSMTNEMCATACAGYTYFGTEYGGECYCGSSLTASLAPAGDCNMPCPGNNMELCGAGLRLTLYSTNQSGGSTSSSSSKSVIASTSTKTSTSSKAPTPSSTSSSSAVITPTSSSSSVVVSTSSAPKSTSSSSSLKSSSSSATVHSTSSVHSTSTTSFKAPITSTTMMTSSTSSKKSSSSTSTKTG